MTDQMHVDQTLTDYAVMWDGKAVNYIGNAAAEPRPVKRRSDRYSVYSRDDFARDDMQPRAPGTEAAELSASVSSDTYYCDSYGGRVKIIHEERDNEDDPVAYEQAKVAKLMRAASIKRERLFVAAAMVNSAWASTNRMVGDASSGSGLNFIRFDQSGGDPVQAVGEAKDLIALGTAGEEANVLVVTRDVHRYFKSQSSILERIKYTGGPSVNPAMVTPEMLAQLFEVQKYLVVDGVYNSSVEGNATQTHAFMASNQMLLMYQSADKYSPTALRQFSWSEYDQAKGPGKIAVRRYDDIPKRVTWIETDVCCDFKVVASTAAVHFATPLTP